MANLLTWLGRAADAVIPGDQSNWHKEDKKAPAPSTAAANIGRGFGYGNSNSTLPYSPPMPAPTPASLNLPKPPQTPQTPGDLIDFINNMAQVGPKAVQAPRVQGDNVEQSNGVQGTLQAIGQLPVLGIPVQIGNAVNDMNDEALARVERGEKPYTAGMVLGGAAKEGIANSPLGPAAQLFGNMANEFTKRAGVGDGTNSAQDNPVFGPTEAISNTVDRQGLPMTALTTGLNVLGAGIGGTRKGEVTKGGPTLGEAGGLVDNERGSLAGDISPEAHELAQRAQANDAHFQEAMSQVAQDFGLKHIAGPPKLAERIHEKSVNDYGGDVSQVQDGVRSTLAVPDPAQVQAIHDALAGKYEINRFKNDFDKEGYKDAKVNIKLPDGTLAEVQMTTPEMLHAKNEGHGHAMYKEARVEEDATKLEALNSKMKALYDDAWAKTQERLAASAADISRPSTTARAGEKFLPVETTVPRTVLPLESSRTITSPTSKNRTDGDVNTLDISSPFNSTIAQNGKNSKGSGNVPGIPVKPTTPTPPGKTTRYAGKTIPESEKVSEPIREQVKANAPKYKVAPEAEGLQSAAETIDRLGPDAAMHDVMKRLDVPNGKISRQDAIDAQAVAAGLDARGGDLAHSQATQIYTKLSEHYTASGQLTQAAAMMARRTPEGLKYQAIHDLRRSGADITDALEAKIDQHIREVKNAKGPKERSTAVGKLKKTVVDAMPQSTLGNIIGVWKAGMISGAKTQGGNLESNAMFGGLKKLADLPATGTDMALTGAGKLLNGIGLKTGLKGERTKTFTPRGIVSGTVEGAKKGVETMKTGFDERNVKGTADKYEQYGEINFGDKNVWQKSAQRVFGKPANFVFRGMSATDQPFHYATLKNSLYDMAKANGLNKGLHGRDLRAHMKEFVNDPPQWAADKALKEATKGTLAHDTLMGVVVPAIKRGIASAPVPKSVKSMATAAVDALVPFSRIPAGFIARTVDFTPLGVGKEVIMQVAGKQFDQRAFSQAVGEGLTGTGVIAIGMQLAQGNLLSGDYPKNDPKEAARWKTEKITPNSLKVGGTWISLNYLGPVGLLFGMGKNFVDKQNDGGTTGDAVGAAIAGLGSGLLNQSFLQGFSNFTDAIKDPQRFAENFQKSEAGSLIPAWSNDLANLTDRWQRETNGKLDAMKARIPGDWFRGSLPIKTDTFGNDLEQPSGNPLNALNPFRPSEAKTSPTLEETDRLAEGGNAVIPLPATTIGPKDDPLKLTPEQQTQRQKMVGQDIQPLWAQIIALPAYQALDDAHKAQALQLALTDYNGATDRRLIAEIAPEKNVKPATGTVADILAGTPPTAQDYIDRANKSQDKANGTSTAKKTSSKAKSSGTKKVSSAKGRKAKAPAMPSPKAFSFKSSTAAISRLLSPTSKAFKTAKIAKAKVPKSRKNIA